jgi:hypothetical protein
MKVVEWNATYAMCLLVNGIAFPISILGKTESKNSDHVLSKSMRD